MIGNEIENETATNNIEIDLELAIESKEAEELNTPKKDTKKKSARKIIFNFSAKKNVFVKIIDDAIKVFQEEKDEAAIEKKKKEPEKPLELKEIGIYVSSLNEIKGIYTQKLGKRKANDLIEVKEEISNNFENKAEEENVEIKQIKTEEKKKKTKKKVPGVKNLLNSEEAKYDMAIAEKVEKKKKKLKAKKNPNNIMNNENTENADPSLKLDTAQKNNNNNLNNYQSERRKLPDPKNTSITNFFSNKGPSKSGLLINNDTKTINNILIENQDNGIKPEYINDNILKDINIINQENPNSSNEENIQNNEICNINNLKLEEPFANQTPYKGNITINNNLNFNVKSNLKISNYVNNYRPDNLNSINNDSEREKKDIFNICDKNNFIYFEPNLDEIKKYQSKLDATISTQNITKFYSMKGEEMEYEDYLKSMKNYFQDVSKLQKNKLLIKNSTCNNNTNLNNLYNTNEIAYQTNKINRKKIIYIQDSALQIRKFNEKKSNLISARNPFKRDDFIIDYDKDSEEEFLEENAEDIKSNENSDVEEEKELVEDDEEENKWIVPDGHLSQDEVSEIDDINIKPEVKSNNIIDILEIRRNFNKPVLIDFRNINNDFNYQKIKKLNEVLRARIFNINVNNIKTYQADIDQNSNLSGCNNNNDFPIRFTVENNENKKGLTGLKDNIHDRLADVCREIHGSLFSKDDIIKNIKEKFPFISKSSLAQFLKDYSERVIVKKFNRKMWYLKESIFREANINEDEAKEIFEDNKKTFEKIYEEKKIQGDKLKKLINESSLQDDQIAISSVNQNLQANNIQGLQTLNIDNNISKKSNTVADKDQKTLLNFQQFLNNVNPANNIKISDAISNEIKLEMSFCNPGFVHIDQNNQMDIDDGNHHQVMNNLLVDESAKVLNKEEQAENGKNNKSKKNKEKNNEALQEKKNELLKIKKKKATNKASNINENKELIDTKGINQAKQIKKKKTSKSVDEKKGRVNNKNKEDTVKIEKNKEKNKKENMLKKRSGSYPKKDNLIKKSSSKNKDKTETDINNHKDKKSSNIESKKKPSKVSKIKENKINNVIDSKPLDDNENQLEKVKSINDQIEINKTAENKKVENLNLSASKQKSKQKPPIENKNTSILSFFNQGSIASKNANLGESVKKAEN